MKIRTLVSSDPSYYEQHSYNDFFSIMPRFKPVNNWNKCVDGRIVIDIFASSKERHKKDTIGRFEWINFKTQHTNKQEIIQACESSLLFIEGFIPSHTLMSQSKCCVPGVLERKLDCYISYDIVIDHPLCNIPMDTD